VRQVALGDLHSCALLDSGAVRCFGSNSNGQLGDGTTSDSDRPTFVLWE
jgi:alpha-tubulin suppressor-like RCC1 family protein